MTKKLDPRIVEREGMREGRVGRRYRGSWSGALLSLNKENRVQQDEEQKKGSTER